MRDGSVRQRVESLWRREGLKVPMKQPMRSRLWLNDGSCIRLKPQHVDHVWSYDFVYYRTEDGPSYRMLNIIDEFSRKCLVIRVKRKLNSTDVIDALTGIFIVRDVPAYIRSEMDRSLSLKPSSYGSRPSAQRPPLYRAWITLGKRLLRELRRPFHGRALKWGDIRFPERSSDRH